MTTDTPVPFGNQTQDQIEQFDLPPTLPWLGDTPDQYNSTIPRHLENQTLDELFDPDQFSDLDEAENYSIATPRSTMALSTTSSAKLQLEQAHARLAAHHVKLAEIELDRAQAQEAATRLDAEIEAETVANLNAARTKARVKLADAIAQPVGPASENMEGEGAVATVGESDGEGQESKTSCEAGSTHESQTKRRHTGKSPENDLDLLPDVQMGTDAVDAAVDAQETPPYHSEVPTAIPFVEPAPAHSAGSENSTGLQHLAIQELIDKNQDVMHNRITKTMAPMLELLTMLKIRIGKKRRPAELQKRGQTGNENDD